MGNRPVSRGERWSNQYRNPTFDYEQDQEVTSMLLQDVRKMMWIGLSIVTVLATMLAVSGSGSAAINLFAIVGFPLLFILLIGEFVRWRRSRNRVPDHWPHD